MTTMSYGEIELFNCVSDSPGTDSWLSFSNGDLNPFEEFLMTQDRMEDLVPNQLLEYPRSFWDTVLEGMDRGNGLVNDLSAAAHCTVEDVNWADWLHTL